MTNRVLPKPTTRLVRAAATLWLGSWIALAAPPVAAQNGAADDAEALESIRQARAALVTEIQQLGDDISPTGVVTVAPSSSPGPGDGLQGPGAGPPAAEVLRPAQSILARLDDQTALLSSPLDPAAAQLPDPRSVPDDLQGFLRLDFVLDATETVEQAVVAGEVEWSEARRHLEDAERRHGLLERRLRRLTEDAPIESGGGEGSITALRWQVRLAKEEARLEKLRLERAAERLEQRRALLEAWHAQATEQRAGIRATEDQLESILADLTARLLVQEQALEELEEALEKAVPSAAPGSDDPGSTELTPGTKGSLLRARIKALELERRARLGEIELLEYRRVIWPIRFEQIAGSSTADDRHRLEDILQHLERRSRSERLRLETLDEQLEQIRRVEVAERGAQTHLDRETDVWLEASESARAVHRRTLDTLTLTRRTLDEGEQLKMSVQDVLVGFRTTLSDAWHVELLVVDDNAVTLGKVVLALLLFAVGYGAAKWVSHAVARVLMQRFSVSTGAGHALQNLIFYLLALSFFLSGLHWVGIPLTALTLLGSVVAIGVGFGSQNVVNNFISGLILLLERPIKVGDLIDVDGVLGSVERIGLRSTVIRAGNNTQIFVPNSSFLEKNVLNWTGSDNLLRSEVDIGVAYESDVEQVKRLMLEALHAEDLVIQRPAPEVLFMEFGDSALLFRAYFWHSVRAGLDPLRVQSALRFRFEKQCSEAGISIAFPQRDLHLDTPAPLQIQLMGRHRADDSEPDLS